MRDIWLIRHGETAWSLSGQHTGRTDLDLTDRGRDEARSLVGRLKSIEFDEVYSSPLKRAKETANLAGYSETALRPDLMEWDYGELEGLTTPEIRQSIPNWEIWSGPIPGGESLEAVAERTRRFLGEVEGRQGRIAVFSHGHLLRVLASCWLKLKPENGRLFALSTASVSVLGTDQQHNVVRSWNMVAP